MDQHRVYDIERIIGRHFFGRRLLRRYANGRATDAVYEVSLIRDDWNGRVLTDLQEELHGLWKRVIDHVIQEGARPRDLIRIHIGHRDLRHGEIRIPLQRIANLTSEAIMERIEKVMQSNKDLLIDDITEISVGVITTPDGEGRMIILSTNDNELKKKRSLVVINNDDDLCLPRALAVCRAWDGYTKKNRWEWRNVCDGTKPHQRELALQMVQNIPNYTSLESLPLYEKHLEANIVVVSATCQNSIIYPEEPNSQYDKTYYLYYVNNNHFHAITKITGLPFVCSFINAPCVF